MLPLLLPVFAAAEEQHDLGGWGWWCGLLYPAARQTAGFAKIPAPGQTRNNLAHDLANKRIHGAHERSW
jgi:hypothetical protein